MDVETARAAGPEMDCKERFPMEKQKPTRPGPKDKPPRDVRDKPAPNPDDQNDLPDTNTREEIEKIRPNLKR